MAKWKSSNTSSGSQQHKRQAQSSPQSQQQPQVEQLVEASKSYLPAAQAQPQRKVKAKTVVQLDTVEKPEGHPIQPTAETLAEEGSRIGATLVESVETYKEQDCKRIGVPMISPDKAVGTWNVLAHPNAFKHVLLIGGNLSDCITQAEDTMPTHTSIQCISALLHVPGRGARAVATIANVTKNFEMSRMDMLIEGTTLHQEVRTKAVPWQHSQGEARRIQHLPLAFRWKRTEDGHTNHDDD